jgi:sulfatase maturation enzyme AslB (radical SAM superfamily)
MITLSAALSEACNLRCSYCNVNKESKDRLDYKLFIAQYHKLRAANPDELIQIDFYGGEPLLQWFSIVKILEAIGNEPNIRFFMPTNGLLLTPHRIELLAKYNVKISLSFDGMWQNTNRLQPRNKETLSRYEALLPMFRTIPNLEIHSMIAAGNYNLLENHLFITKLFGLNPHLTLVRDIGTWNADSVTQLKKGIDELFAWYISNASTVDMPNFISRFYKHIVLYKVKKHEVHSCGAGETHLSFSENKEVPCNRFKNQPDVIRKIPIFRAMPACQTCEVRYYCTKGCLYEQINNDGPIVELCDIYKYIYASIFKMISTIKHVPRFVELTKKEILNEY